MADELLLRPEEVARRTGIGRTTVYAEIKAGRLKSVRVGQRTRRVPVAALEEWIADRLAEGAAGNGEPDVA